METPVVCKKESVSKPCPFGSILSAGYDHIYNFAYCELVINTPAMAVTALIPIGIPIPVNRILSHNWMDMIGHDASHPKRVFPKIKE